MKAKEINEIAIELAAFDPTRLTVEELSQHYCSLA